MESKKIIEMVNKNGGLTLNKNKESFNSKSGFMVSLLGMEYKTQSEEEVINKVNEYIKIIENKKGLYVGLWLDNGYYYVDLSIKVNDKVDALELGKKNKQLSVYDMQNDSYLYIKDYKFIRYYTLYDVIKDSNNNIIDYKIIKQYDTIKEVMQEMKATEKTIKNCITEKVGKAQRLLLDNFRITCDYMLIDM